MKRIILGAVACLLAAACSGGSEASNGTCTYQGQTFTDFIQCPDSTVCCPTYDNCTVISGGGYSCTSN
jgi:hypothetical protein